MKIIFIYQTVQPTPLIACAVDELRNRLDEFYRLLDDRRDGEEYERSEQDYNDDIRDGGR